MAAPVFSPEELASFHATHFSSSTAEDFALNFLGPVEDDQYEEYEEQEDDGLGYYADGTKRTLTDEQIAIFRHSEIQGLLKKRRQAAETAVPFIGPVYPTPNIFEAAVPVLEDGEFEDGEVEDGKLAESTTSTQHSKKKKTAAYSKSKAKKGERGRERGYFKEKIKPDLRKRTWDVVEKGLADLDYDEGTSNAASAPAPQRRRITYDDD